MDDFEQEYRNMPGDSIVGYTIPKSSTEKKEKKKIKERILDELPAVNSVLLQKITVLYIPCE